VTIICTMPGGLGEGNAIGDRPAMNTAAFGCLQVCSAASLVKGMSIRQQNPSEFSLIFHLHMVPVALDLNGVLPDSALGDDPHWLEASKWLRSIHPSVPLNSIPRPS
jgi:hypothetical protein